MEKFTRITGIAAPFPRANVDTDTILPKEFLKTVTRGGLGQNLFDELRYTADGAEKPDFILNRAPFRAARILLAGDNFGCGSSREHAVWALRDFGIRVIIAPAFADIFYNNCFKNGLLPVMLDPLPLADLTRRAETGTDKTLTVDLGDCTISGDGMARLSFTIEPFRRRCLLEGLDEIALSLQNEAAIEAFEAARASRQPWLAGPITVSDCVKGKKP